MTTSTNLPRRDARRLWAEELFKCTLCAYKGVFSVPEVARSAICKGTAVPRHASIDSVADKIFRSTLPYIQREIAHSFPLNHVQTNHLIGPTRWRPII
jgi:hypothetical protein